ncbi:RNA polymerase sigma factor [Chitinophaga sp. XS-30]|uniref:RNA polymerase sigma factor n=1 Tax=Chitinophaga sp. XS-30 TaxID=2604421 RepID=UPI0011DDFE20|nr:sigma-70 family RNA polymerase sigma factor [Chitinophaga sp. XS-30]QEH39447.1 sigma-70 family RNA polymerase sigma factor [Chitinophaga sp. XS-30]
MDNHSRPDLTEEAKEAFSTVFRTHYKLLCAHAYTLLQDEQAAKDAVQQAFMLCMQRHADIHSIASYLHKAVYHNCLKMIELRKRQSSTYLDDALANKESVYPDQDLLAGQDFSKVRQLETALEQLPRQCKEAMRLVYIERRKYNEAADIMGISKNSIKTHLRKGISSLRLLLKSPFSNA